MNSLPVRLDQAVRPALALLVRPEKMSGSLALGGGRHHFLEGDPSEPMRRVSLSLIAAPVLALSRLLLDRIDSELTSEQVRQISRAPAFSLRSARSRSSDLRELTSS